MTDSNWMEKTGATKGKLALIAVLAAILVGVIGVQFRNHSPTTNTERTRATSGSPLASRRADDSQPSGGSSPPSAQTAETPTWPELSMADVVLNDPLAVPPWFEIVTEDAAPADSEDQLAAEAERRHRNALALNELQQQGASIVVLAEGDEVAAIGEQSVRIGDIIEGFQITDITKRGVVLTEIKQR